MKEIKESLTKAIKEIEKINLEINKEEDMIKKMNMLTKKILLEKKNESVNLMFKFNTLILNGYGNYVDNNPEIFKDENINICSNNHIKPKKRKNSNEIINDTEKKNLMRIMDI